jgi:3-hydroxyacyl-CoA dehydrogenase
MTAITTERRGAILLVIANNPPVNTLATAVRQGLKAAIDEAAGDDAVKAVVIACHGRTFFAGADIKEFASPMIEPHLAQLVDLIEASAKPVVAAIHGTALGGGCELALSCHYRIAVPSAKFGLPEVKLGLLPGAGGTQRLPRLTGAAAALEMIAKGDPIGAGKAQEIGLVDRLAREEHLIDDAIAFAEMIADQRPLPRVSECPLPADPTIFADFRAANARRFRGFDAPRAIVDLIEASAGLPYAQGIALELAAFLKLMSGMQSAAQRHAFFAERLAAKIDDLPADTTPRAIAQIGVIGAGTMGSGIAMSLLSAGFSVKLVDADPAALERGAATIGGYHDAHVAKGRLGREAAQEAMARLAVASDLDALSGCDLVIEAVFENMALKKDIFAQLDRIAKPGAILASNTSFLDIDEIAAVTARPQDVIGLHFFSPAHIMKLLEVVRGRATAPDVLATAMGLARTLGKIAVVAGVCHGFIGNRMLIPRQQQADALLLEGATPGQIDEVHVDFGMPMGPFQMGDLAGVDVGWHRDPSRIDTIRDALAAEGRWGQKTQAGYYDYDGRQPVPSPRAAEIIAGFRDRAGLPHRAIDEDEIVARTLYVMVNEGAKILDEGMAQRASDIDVVWVHGYGWPVYRGGPMFWADTVGLPAIVAGLDRYGLDVAPSLRAKASRGESFNR